MALEIPEATPQTIVAVVDYAMLDAQVTSDKAAAFCEISDANATAALAAAVLLGLLTKTGLAYEPADWTTQLLGDGSAEQKRQIFRAHLERFEPFAYVRRRILQGFDILHACREAKTLFDLAPAPAVIRDTFSGWGAFARSLVGDPPAPDTSSGLDSPLAVVIDPILDAGAAAEEYVSDALGTPAYLALDPGVRDKLIVGVRRFMTQEEARTVGQPIGIALEDFLRGIADKHTIDVSTKNGIGQVGKELRSNNKLAKKHVGLIDAANAVRIAIEHGQDADEGKDWRITPQGLRLLISITMLAIRSISAYDAHGDLDL